MWITSLEHNCKRYRQCLEVLLQVIFVVQSVFFVVLFHFFRRLFCWICFWETFFTTIFMNKQVLHFLAIYKPCPVTFAASSFLAQANKLISKSTFPASANNSEFARYLFYVGEFQVLLLSLSHSLTQLLTQLLTHSTTHSFTHSLARSLTHSLNYLLHSLNYSLTLSFTLCSCLRPYQSNPTWLYRGISTSCTGTETFIPFDFNFNIFVTCTVSE